MTMKSLAAALALAVLPDAAFAQQPPPQVVVAPNSAPVLAGVTVSGRGTVRRRADALRFSAVIPAVNNARSVESADQLVAALRANGVADAQVQPPGPFVDRNSSLVVTGTVRSPSDARLRELIAKVGAATPNVTIQTLTYAPYLDDCSADEQHAIDAALADARRRAGLAAAAAHVALGDVLSMNVFTTSAGCPTKPGGMPSQGSIGPRDGGPPTDVVVEGTVSVTFAIAAPEGGARRRPL